MHPAAAVRVCEFIIANCRQLRGVIFTVRFMMQTLRAELTLERANELSRIELGAFILLLLPTDVQFKLRPLVTNPQRILEHLLMNKQVAAVKLALSQMDAQDAEALTSEYAFSQGRARSETTSLDDTRSGGASDGRKSPSSHRKGQLGTLAAASSAASGTTPFVGRKAALSVSGAGAGLQRRIVEKVSEFRHDLISFYAEKAVAVKSPHAADWPADWIARFAFQFGRGCSSPEFLFSVLRVYWGLFYQDCFGFVRYCPHCCSDALCVPF